MEKTLATTTLDFRKGHGMRLVQDQPSQPKPSPKPAPQPPQKENNNKPNAK